MRCGLLLALAALVGGCGGGSDDTSGGGSGGNPITGAVTPSSLPQAEPGAGSMVVDGVTYDFEVESCVFRSTDGAERGVPVVLFSLAGSGVGPGDEPLTVSVERVFVEGDTNTFADSIVLRQPGLNFLVQADRSESDGVIIDLRDPMAATPLLKLGDQHVSGSGTFGSRDGTAADPTLPGTLAAGCP